MTRDLKGRQFSMGVVASLKKLITDKFNSLERRVYGLLRGTLKVRVMNPPKPRSLKEVVSGLDSVVEAVNKIEIKEPDLSELKKLDDVKEAIKSIKFPEQKDVDFSGVQDSLAKLEKAIRDIKIPDNKFDNSAVVAEIKRLQYEVGKIDYPEIRIPDFDTSNIIRELQALRVSIAALPQPKAAKLSLDGLLKPLTRIEKQLKKQPPEIEFPSSISVDNFPPTKTPQPVTNININGLRGPVLASQISVLTTATPLPATPLSDRRSVIFFNNDSSKTIYVGGSSVTVASGMPVPPKQYAPPIDLSDRVDLYGIVSTGTAEARVLEASMDDVGS